MKSRTLHKMCLAMAAAALATTPAVAGASEAALPWLGNIGAVDRRQNIHTLVAEAHVSVSDGLTYSVHTVFHDAQRTVFQRIYADRTVTQGVDGLYRWTYDGRSETEASPFVGQIVLGHQFHAQILFYDRLHGLSGAPEVGRFGNQDCLVVASADTTVPGRFYFTTENRPLGLAIERQNAPDVLVAFDDWRKVAGMELPHLLTIDDGERVFRYEYSQIRVNEGSIADFRAPFEVLSEAQKLLRLHRIAMDDHFFGRTDGICASRGDSLLIVSDGEVFRVTGEEFDAMMHSIMTSRDYLVYDDLIRPVVEVSEDGTRGWVIVQVYARGHRLDADGKPGPQLQFRSGWVSLYRKVDGQWKLSGNVSNVQHEPE